MKSFIKNDGKLEKLDVKTVDDGTTSDFLKHDIPSRVRITSKKDLLRKLDESRQAHTRQLSFEQSRTKPIYGSSDPFNGKTQPSNATVEDLVKVLKEDAKRRHKKLAKLSR